MYNVYISMVPYNNLYQKMVNKENFLCHLSLVFILHCSVTHAGYNDTLQLSTKVTYFQCFNYLTQSLEAIVVQSERRNFVTMLQKLHVHQ